MKIQYYNKVRWGLAPNDAPPLVKPMRFIHCWFYCHCRHLPVLLNRSRSVSPGRLLVYNLVYLPYTKGFHTQCTGWEVHGQWAAESVREADDKSVKISSLGEGGARVKCVIGPPPLDCRKNTFSRQSAHRWRWGCQLYAPAAL
jgi:hypothetical protein